jgi:DMSO/TMAO reductase YedYZ molybdopterin-dependent catalytic subunit
MNSKSKKLLKACNNNNQKKITELIILGADPFLIYGIYLQDANAPFKEWYNSYLKNALKNINILTTYDLDIVAKLVKVDTSGLSRTSIIKLVTNNISQHILFPIWYQHINSLNSGTLDQTPNEVNKSFVTNTSARLTPSTPLVNPYTLAFNDVIIDSNEQGYGTHGIATPDLTGKPTSTRPQPQSNFRDFSLYEVALAFRCHGFPMEAMNYPITPLGLHFLLIHFDIPTQLVAQDYKITVGGQVINPLIISLDELKKGPVVERIVTMQCAGVGRGLVNPRPVYVPWSKECIGTYKWTGTPLKNVLERAGLLEDALEVVFTGWDTGVDLGIEHAYEKAISIEEALNGDVMLCWAQNDVALLPQHGFPLRVIIPSYYGSYSVKWLRAITVIKEKFKGVQQNVYTEKRTYNGSDNGVHFSKKDIDSLILPPGIPDLLTRHRFIAPGKIILKGYALSGWAKIKRVEVSVDCLKTWNDAKLIFISNEYYAWVRWEYEWNPIEEGNYTIASRAYDEAGNVQFLNPENDWNRTAMGITSVERLFITVKNNIGISKDCIPSNAQLIIPGATIPIPVSEMKCVKTNKNIIEKDIIYYQPKKDFNYHTIKSFVLPTSTNKESTEFLDQESSSPTEKSLVLSTNTNKEISADIKKNLFKYYYQKYLKYKQKYLMLKS